MLGYCGLRWGEAVALTVAKCDLLRSRLVVDASVVDLGGSLSAGTSKSGQRREVPVSRFLRNELAMHLAGKGPGELVFPAPRGGYLRTRTSGVVASTRPLARLGSTDWSCTSCGTPRLRPPSDQEPTSKS